MWRSRQAAQICVAERKNPVELTRIVVWCALIASCSGGTGAQGIPGPEGQPGPAGAQGQRGPAGDQGAALDAASVEGGANTRHEVIWRDRAGGIVAIVGPSSTVSG